MWIFGYGSLTWKVGFPNKGQVTGYVKGYIRRFWQGSIDHRGVPERPGRVVTLVESTDTDSCVWGVAYEISDEVADDVLAHLNYRERNGYKSLTLPFYSNETRDSPDFDVITYIATEENDTFMGPAPIPDIARQIFDSRGESGENREYLYKLAESMRAIAPSVYDEHLDELEREVRKLDLQIGSR